MDDIIGGIGRARRTAPGALGRFAARGAAMSLFAGAAVVGASGASSAAAPTLPIRDGLNSHDAAASCWEIKQLHPSSPDGQYWLRTSSLERPEQFYCDMTTDGGGWVLIGRGREGWTFRDYGQSTPQNIRTTPNGPGAFSPGALSSSTIDGLLEGGAVNALADGIRLRRATNTGGTAWQEIRWHMLDLTSWSWSVGGGHRLSTFSINGSGGTGSNTKDSKIRMTGEVGSGNRGADQFNAWFTYPWGSHGGSAGFSYAGNVGGQNNASSYLWEFGSENHAIPFTQVYIRPQITTPTLPSIPDGGVAAQTQTPLLDDRPLEIAGGVVGVLKIGDTEPAVDAPVLAITTIGDRVYVGGKFSQVRDTATGNLVSHPYLAAFDRTTGAWISSFDPDLDGTVWDLDTVDGKLIVAGQFTNVDGVALTAGLAALDPTTGAVLPGWRASLELGNSSDRPYARTIDVEGSSIYVGGNFTAIRQSATIVRSRGRLARLAATTGSSNNTFLPNVDGVPYDIDANGGRVYVVGKIFGINEGGFNGVGVVDWTNGDIVPGLFAPVQTAGNASRQYQQAVVAVGSDVWQGGSEHNTHAYRAADYGYEKGYVTSNRGGDTQAFAVNDGVVYQGSHANAWIYHDATKWPGLDDYTRADDYKWVGAFHASTRAYDRNWVPSLDSGFSEGTWAMHTDASGCTWFGGDFIGGPYVSGQRQYLEGFSKFCQRDVQAPTVPTNGSADLEPAGGVEVRWTQSTDDFPGFIGYEVLRNDRVVSPLVYGSKWTDPAGTSDDRYFVRAVDPAGNRSASTTVLTADIAGDTSPPRTPRDLAATLLPDDSVDLTWTASTDNVGVDHYIVFRNGVEILQVPGDQTAVNIADLGPGSHWLQVRAVDAAGNESYKTPSVRVDIEGPDTQKPSIPGNPTATYDEDTELITFSWTASVDDTGVEGYIVRRNLTDVADVDGTTLSVDLDLGYGGHYLQVRAYDAAGNESWKTLPVFIEVGPDIENPRTPRDLTAVALPDGTVDAAWTASTDNVGVDHYIVYRNSVEILQVPGTDTAVNITDLGAGTHYIQVRAVDAAGNQSYKTPSVMVVIDGPDTENPRTPRDLTATAQPDGSIIATWTASTDNVGVDYYRVTRNLTEVAIVPGTETTVVITGLGAGTHYIQVQAFDAAGNSSYRTPSAVVTI
ncbi:MAG: hypothetical protein HKN44_03765 [Ilumatobacter sp.]|nr:hypothetical protein [Ilumatobacter sp.]